MLAWLTSEDVIAKDGGVISWHAAEHPGYRYPEVAGLLLRLLSVEGTHDRLSRRIVVGLIADEGPTGGFGKAGREYLFDTAVVLAGLTAYQARAIDPDADKLRDGCLDFIARAMVEQRASTSTSREHRWSECMAPHLLKLLGLLEPMAVGHRSGEIAAELQNLAGRLVVTFDGDRFPSCAHISATYIHAACYALEGLSNAAIPGDNHAATRWPAVVRAGTDRLARCQHSTGGLPAWDDGSRTIGPLRTDATAQAVRLWALVDRDRYEANIAFALAFLAWQQDDCGGLRYEPGSPDVNSWATIFAVQATRWAVSGHNDEGVL